MSPDQRTDTTSDRDPSMVLAVLGVADSATPPAPPNAGEIGLDDIATEEQVADSGEGTISDVDSTPVSQEASAATPQVIGEGAKQRSSANAAITPELKRTQIAGEVLAKCKDGDLEGAIDLLIQIDSPAVVAILQGQLEATAKRWAEKLVQNPLVDTDRPMAVAAFEQARIQAEAIAIPELRAMIMITIDQAEARFIQESRLSPEEQAICATRIRNPLISTDVILQALYSAIDIHAQKTLASTSSAYDVANGEARAIAAKYLALTPIKPDRQQGLVEAVLSYWISQSITARKQLFKDPQNRKPISNYVNTRDLFVTRP